MPASNSTARLGPFSAELLQGFNIKSSRPACRAAAACNSSRDSSKP